MENFTRYLFFFILIIFFQSVDIYAEVKQWKMIKEKDNIKTYIRPSNGKIKEFKGEGIDNVRFEVISEVLLDIPGYINWIDYIKESRIIKRINDDYLIVYQCFDIPWPFNDRDCIVEVKIERDYKKGIFKARFHSLKENMIPMKKSVVRINNLTGDVELVYIDKVQTKGYFSEWIDFGGNIPAWLTNLLSKNIPFHVLTRLRKECKESKRKEEADKSPIKKKIEELINKK